MDYSKSGYSSSTANTTANNTTTVNTNAISNTNTYQPKLKIEDCGSFTKKWRKKMDCPIHLKMDEVAAMEYETTGNHNLLSTDCYDSHITKCLICSLFYFGEFDEFKNKNIQVLLIDKPIAQQQQHERQCN